MTMKNLTAARKQATTWIAQNAELNATVAARLGETGVADGYLIEALTNSAARTRVGHQVVQALDYLNQNHDADSPKIAAGLMDAVITNAQQNLATTSEGERAIRVATTGAWLTIGRLLTIGH